VDDFRAMEAAACSGDFGEWRRDFAKWICDEWLVGRDGAGTVLTTMIDGREFTPIRLRAEQPGDS